MNFATAIQKTWRGHNARKIYATDQTDGSVKIDTVNSTEKPSTEEEIDKRVMPPRLLIPQKEEPDAFSNDVTLGNNTLPNQHSARLPFNARYNVDLLVDSVVGLPVTTTATRVQVKFLMPTREVVGNVIFEYSDLGSESTSPVFKLRHQWKGSTLHPTITIVCQVETLESFSLLPKVVGVAVLRLCVDHSGLQPISEVIYDDRPSCYFNTGQFMVPLLYGVVGEEFEYITEAKLHEQMCHIDGAFVRMAVVAAKPGDHIIDHPFSSNMQREFSMASSVRTDSISEYKEPPEVLSFASTSVASTVWRTYQALLDHHRGKDGSHSHGQSSANSSFHSFGMHPSSSGTHVVANTLKLPVPAPLLAKFQQGEVLLDEERDAVLVNLQTFITRSFEQPVPHSPTPTSQGPDSQGASHAATSLLHSLAHVALHGHSAKSAPPSSVLVSPGYLCQYRAATGALMGLDMLHNMPDRKDLIDAAQQAASAMAAESGLLRQWEDRIVCFKTVFRYLPGLVFDGEGDCEEQVIRCLKDQSEREKMLNSSFRSTGPMAEGMDIIIDDVSVKPCLGSNELNPAYTDDYSCTTGMKLGPFACLLVVVTAVDVLTGHAASCGDDEEEVSEMHDIHAPLPEQQPHAQAHPHPHMRSKSTEVDRTAHSSSKKMSGLMGIYVGHGDPKATWWGLVPVFKTLPPHLVAALPAPRAPLYKNPAQYVPSSPSHSTSASPKNAGSAKPGRSQAPNFLQIPTVEENWAKENSLPTPSANGELGIQKFFSVDTSATSSVNKSWGASLSPKIGKSPATVPSDSAMSSPLPGGGGGAAVHGLVASLAQVASLPLFINDGSHLVPLFAGLPPEEMMHAPDPLLWLTKQLNNQRSKLSLSSSSLLVGGSPGSTLQRSLSFLMSPFVSLFAGVTTPRNKSNKKKKRKKSNQPAELVLELSTGCSAVVRMGHPLMRRLAPLPICDQRDKPVMRSAMELMFRIATQQAGAPSAAHEDDTCPIVNQELLRLLHSHSTDQAKVKALRQLFTFCGWNSGPEPRHSLHLGLPNVATGVYSGAGSNSSGASTPRTPRTRLSSAHGNKHAHRRSLEFAIASDGLDAKDLVVQINHKFYEALSG